MKEEDYSELIHVPKYFHHGTIEGKRYIVMQYLERSLIEHIMAFSAGQERDQEIQRLAIQMMEAL